MFTSEVILNAMPFEGMTKYFETKNEAGIEVLMKFAFSESFVAGHPLRSFSQIS